MTPEEIRAWLEGNEPPFVFKTIGLRRAQSSRGRSYKITARSNVWVPAAYPEMLCVAVPGKGIIIIKISTIESVHIEHEMVSAR
jgi:hypothetical protein